MSKYEKYSWFATAEEQQKEEKYVKIANERIAKLQKCGVVYQHPGHHQKPRTGSAQRRQGLRSRA